MEPEDSNLANKRSAATSSLPGITLAVLIALIIALLYIGYEYIRDDTGGAQELTNVALDTTSQQPLTLQSAPEMVAVEEAPDTSSTPAPVDLSQAEPPADASVADKPAASAANDKGTKTDEADAGKTKKETKPAPENTKPKTEATPAKAPVAGTSSSHTVEAGETFYGIANRYNLKPSTLRALNPGVSESSVKSGVTRLKVRVRAVHTVGAGDVLRVVAEKYGVSKEALMRANGKTKDIATRGEKLIIPYAEKH